MLKLLLTHFVMRKLDHWIWFITSPISVCKTHLPFKHPHIWGTLWHSDTPHVWMSYMKYPKLKFWEIRYCQATLLSPMCDEGCGRSALSAPLLFPLFPSFCCSVRGQRAALMARRVWERLRLTTKRIQMLPSYLIILRHRYLMVIWCHYIGE